jgi:hypothetical protein
MEDAMTSSEDELRARFGELRAAEAAAAPGLLAVMHGARRESRRSPRRRTAMLLVGAAASIVAVTLVIRQVRLEAAAKLASVAAWRSPTTSLMPTTPHSVLAPPPLLSSVLDGATSSTLWRKGD